MSHHCNINISYYFKASPSMLENKDELDDFLWKELDEKVYLAYDCDNTYEMLVFKNPVGHCYQSKKEDFFGVMDLENQLDITESKYLQELHLYLQNEGEGSDIIPKLKAKYPDFDDTLHLGLMVLYQ